MLAMALVGGGGAAGALLRYGVSAATGRFWPAAFPLATLLINICGSLLMGLLAGALARWLPPWQSEARLLLGTGVLGGFTTFSAFSLDAVTLIERGEIGEAALYVGASVVGSLLALYLGLMVVRGAGS